MVRPGSGRGRADHRRIGHDRVGAPATVRQVIPFRVHGVDAQLLLAGAGRRTAGFPNGKPGWIEVRSLPELQVRVDGLT